MLERLKRRSPPAVGPVAHRTALERDQRMVPVAPFHRGRESKDGLRAHCIDHGLECRRRERMAFINYYLPVFVGEGS
jgi:hypothetical protein